MIQNKLTLKEILQAFLKSAICLEIYVLITTLFVISRSAIFSIAYYVLLFFAFLAINYLVFHVFLKNDISRIRSTQFHKHISLFGWRRITRMLFSHHLGLFVLTHICFGIMTLIIGTGSIFFFEFSLKLIEKWFNFHVKIGWGKLGIATAIIFASWIMCLMLGDWFAYRTRNIKLKWASTLPILCVDIFALFFLIFYVLICYVCDTMFG